MNKLCLLFLLSSSILLGMEKKEKESSDSKPNVSFSPEALDKLVVIQEAISALSTPSPITPVTPPSIPRTKLSPGERFPTRPDLSPNKFLAHRDSAPDTDGAKVAQVRQFKHLSRSSQDKEEQEPKSH